MSWGSDFNDDYGYGYDDYGGSDFDDDDDYGYGYDDRDYGESDGDYDYDYDDYEDCYVSRRSDRESTEDGSRRFENYAQGRELLAELAIQRKTGEFLDVVVQVEGREFPCHRAVLATTPYFKAMLSSNLTSKVVRLRGIDSTSFSKILDFLYSGEICIGEDDVQDILQTAHMLQFDKIIQYCREFIQDNLCLANCLGVMRLADMYDLSALKKSARSTAAEFLSLSPQGLLDLLRDEDLKVRDEDDVVTSVIRWLDQVPENRQTAILKILPEIRLSRVRVSVLQKLESHPVIRESAECLAKITAAREKHLLGTRVVGEDASSPRRGTSDNLAIIVGGWKAVTKQHPYYRQYRIIVQPTPLKSIICLDPDSKRYYHVSNIPTPVYGYMSVASAEGYLYVTGGRVQPLVGHGPHTAPSRQAFRYDFSSDTWLRLPDMPAGRAEHQSVVVDGKLFLVGGDTDATSLKTMDCYDPEEGAWIKVPLLPTIHSPSDLTVTAFWDKVVFIKMSESADSHTYIDVQLGIAMHFAMEPTIQPRNGHELCVHAFDLKTKGWTYTHISVDTSLKDVVIVPTAVNDKLHIRTGHARYSDLYIFDAEEGTLNKSENMQDRENVLHAKSKNNYHSTEQKGIVDTISYHDLGDHYPARQTPLPFALFGHSFLETKKSRVGWYCRDLARLEVELEGSD
ncbi:kelch-like protein 24 [Branchiostoma floridae]|uniref:Kelch-like protein 24 n=1 Tax=Branchiostoma floridae TaxID=7739 RepID=A0A9J7N608_BRAFL|nr:kelch-like protein 24 [Branchiostoma floridae]